MNEQISEAFVDGFMSKCAEAGLEKEAAIGLLRGLAAKAFPGVRKGIAQRAAQIVRGTGGEKAVSALGKRIRGVTDTIAKRQAKIVAHQNEFLDALKKTSPVAAPSPGQLGTRYTSRWNNVLENIPKEHMEFLRNRASIEELQRLWKLDPKGMAAITRRYGRPMPNRLLGNTQWDTEAFLSRVKDLERLRSLGRLQARNLFATDMADMWKNFKPNRGYFPSFGAEHAGPAIGVPFVL